MIAAAAVAVSALSRNEARSAVFVAISHHLGLLRPQWSPSPSTTAASTSHASGNCRAAHRHAGPPTSTSPTTRSRWSSAPKTSKPTRSLSMVFAPVDRRRRVSTSALEPSPAWGPPGSAHDGAADLLRVRVGSLRCAGHGLRRGIPPRQGRHPVRRRLPAIERRVKIDFHGQTVARLPRRARPARTSPAAFGWLDTDGSECAVATVVGAVSTVDPGSSPSNGCDPQDLADMMGTVQVIPYFDVSSGNGNNAAYHVKGYGALYVTGSYFAGQYHGEVADHGQLPLQREQSLHRGLLHRQLDRAPPEARRRRRRSSASPASGSPATAPGPGDGARRLDFAYQGAAPVI